jgi:DNA-binding MarR family transcriptional regulator
MHLSRSILLRRNGGTVRVVKVVELIWLGQQLTEVGRAQLQANAPGVPRHELVVMADLIENAPSTITDIAQRTGYVQSRVSAAVASLAERGWVRTEADPSDGRRTVVVVPGEILAGARAAQDGIETRLASALLEGVPGDRQPAVMEALGDLLIAMRAQAERPRDTAAPVQP